MSKKLTVKAVIEILGGYRAVAELTSSKYHSVVMWVAHSKFPAKTYLVIKAALEKRGHNAPPELWGML